MTNSQNTQNEQQKDLCITDDTLTEQWKQKKLPLGWYFVKDKAGKIDYAEYMEWFNADGWCGNHFEYEEEIVEVLAEAPDYIDWQNMVNCACEEHKANTELLEENAELKEVCDVFIRKYPEMKEWVMMNWKHLYEVQDD